MAKEAINNYIGADPKMNVFAQMTGVLGFPCLHSWENPFLCPKPRLHASGMAEAAVPVKAGWGDLEGRWLG